MREQLKHLYEFGHFRLDTAGRMLLRDGQYVPLSPKAFDTLQALVARGGRIADREELIKEIWPDTFVEDVSLAKSISTLRKVLDELGGPGYIETVPRRGYRFAAEIRILDEPAIEESQPVAPPAPLRPDEHPAHQTVPAAKPARGIAAGIRVFGLLALVASGLGGWVLYFRHAPSAASALNTVPLTSYPGRQRQVAFSPDGGRIAFAWSGPENTGSRIYVKPIGNDNLIPITKGDGADSKPAWSPDGRYLAFVRTSPKNRAVYLTPVDGGAERKIADIFTYFDLGAGNSPYFAPDGRSLALPDKESGADPASIYLISITQPERRKLTSPPAGSTGDFYPSFSPDGKYLAFARAANFSSFDIYVVPASGGTPKRLTIDSLLIQGLAWTPDSREIVFASRRGGSVNSLWRVPVKGGTPRRIDVIGKDVISPAISAGGNRLAYVHNLDDFNIWRVDLDERGRPSPPQRWIASTFRDSDPSISPDSSKLAFASLRSGTFGIWVCESDGSNPHILFDGGPNLTGSPRWSPDGKWITFDSRANARGPSGLPSIYVMPSEGGAAREIVAGDGVAPSWSRDGRSIYFVSTRTGSSQVFKIPSAGGAPVQVTHRGAFEAYESFDGKTLYFLKGRELPGIWKMPVGGGEETLATAQDEAGAWRYWQVGARGLYFAAVKADRGPVVEFYDFATGAVSEVARMAKEPELNSPGLAFSRDGRFFLYMQDDQNGSDVMMLEGFR